MAVEVHDKRYHFKPEELTTTTAAAPAIFRRLPVPVTTDLFASTSLVKDIVEKIDGRILRYKPLHDIESTWWLMAFSLLNKDVQVVYRDSNTFPLTFLIEDPAVRSERLKKQAQYAETLFLFGHGRKDTLMLNRILLENLRYLHPALLGVGEALNTARIHLVRAYTQAEEDVDSIDYNAANGVYGQLRSALLRGIMEANAALYAIHISCSVSTAHHDDTAASSAKAVERNVEDSSSSTEVEGCGSNLRNSGDQVNDAPADESHTVRKMSETTG